MVGKAVVSPAPCMDYGYHAQRANVSIIRTSERWASGCWKKVRLEREYSPSLVVFWGWPSLGGLRLMQSSSWVCPPDSWSWIFGCSICFSGRAVEYLSNRVPGSAHTCLPVQSGNCNPPPPHKFSPLRPHKPHEDPDWLEMQLEVKPIRMTVSLTTEKHCCQPTFR